MIIFSFEVKGQESTDSLLIKLESIKNDTDKVIIYNKLCIGFRNSNLQNSLFYGKKGLQFAYEIRYFKGIADICSNLGACYCYLGNNTQALNFFNIALFFYTKSGSEIGIANTYNNIGTLFSYSGNYVKALEYYLKALEKYSLLNNNKDVSSCYNNIGIIYCNQQNFNKAIEYYSKSLNIYLNHNDTNRIISPLINIGLVYFKLNKVKESLKCLYIAKYLSKKTNNSDGFISSCINFGSVYKSINEYDKALINFKNAYTIIKEIDNKIWMFNCLNYLTELYYLQKDYSNALFYGQKAYEMSKTINFLEQQKKCYYNLSALYDTLGNHNQALMFYKLYNDVNDSIFNEENQKKLIEIEAKFENEKNEKEIIKQNTRIKLLEKNKEIAKYKSWGLLCLAIISLISLIILRKKVKTDKHFFKQKIKYHETHKVLSDLELNNQKIKSSQLQQELDFKEKELKYKQQELINLALHITEKNEFLKKIKRKINISKKKNNVDELNDLINSSFLNIEKDRNLFNAYVENVSHSFLLKIHELAPDVTKSEDLLALHLKLNLTTKKIAAITNISEKSVEIARFRLRRKLNLNKNENISEFLNKL